MHCFPTRFNVTKEHLESGIVDRKSGALFELPTQALSCAEEREKEQSVTNQQNSSQLALLARNSLHKVPFDQFETCL